MSKHRPEDSERWSWRDRVIADGPIGRDARFNLVFYLFAATLIGWAAWSMLRPSYQLNKSDWECTKSRRSHVAGGVTRSGGMTAGVAVWVCTQYTAKRP